MMVAHLQARGRDVELRAQFEAEVAERQQRAGAEAKGIIEVRSVGNPGFASKGGSLRSHGRQNQKGP